MSYISREELELQIGTLTNERNNLALELVNVNEQLEQKNSALLLLGEELNVLRIKGHNSDVVRDFIIENEFDETKTYTDLINLINSLTQS